MEKRKIKKFVKRLKGIEATVEYAKLGEDNLREVTGKVVNFVPDGHIIMDLKGKKKLITFSGYDCGIYSVSVFGKLIYENKDVALFYRFNEDVCKKARGELSSLGKYLVS